MKDSKKDQEEKSRSQSEEGERVYPSYEQKKIKKRERLLLTNMKERGA